MAEPRDIRTPGHATVPSIEERTDRLREELGVDAIVVSSRHSVAHLGGVNLGHLNWLDITQRAFVVWAGEGRRRFLAPGWCELPVREATDLEISIWSFPDPPLKALADVLREMGLGEGRLGVEATHMTLAVEAELRGYLPGLELVPVDDALVRNRAQKTAGEVERLARAARAAEIGMAEAIAAGGEGMTEREFAAAIHDAILRAGADEFGWLALRWGTLEQRQSPSDKPIRAGEIISIELGCVVDGYLADVQRTLVVPPAPAALLDAYRRLAEVHRQTLAGLVVGRPIADVNREFLERMAAQGLEMWPWYQLGHSLGLDLHEGYFIEDSEPAEILPGMVFAIEPVIESPGMLAIEDDVYVADDGPEVLSMYGDWSELPLLGRPVEVPR